MPPLSEVNPVSDTNYLFVFMLCLRIRIALTICLLLVRYATFLRPTQAPPLPPRWREHVDS